MNQKVSERIKILGFVMTCFMVFYHCAASDASSAVNAIDGSFNRLISYDFDKMGVLVMSHFFAVTGFLLFNNLNMKNYPKKIKRRVFSLLIPYVTWQVIIAIKLVLQGKYIFSLKDYLYTTFGLVAWPLDGAMWYVYAIFLLALLSPIFLLIFKNEKVGWSIVLILIIFWATRWKIHNPQFLKVFGYGYVANICSYLPSYIVGAFFGKFYSQLNEQKSLAYILSILFMAFLLQGAFPDFLYDITIRMMPILALALLPVVSSVKDVWVYKLTFLMYAMHQPLIGDIKPHIYNLYARVSIPASVSNVLTRIIILSIDICLSAVIYVVLKKFAPKVLNTLTGGRD